MLFFFRGQNGQWIQVSAEEYIVLGINQQADELLLWIDADLLKEKGYQIVAI